jgi:hypothetical protein
MSMINRSYLLRGVSRGLVGEMEARPDSKGVKGPPRNLLIQFLDGRKVVRPFRGPRKPSPP